MTNTTYFFNTIREEWSASTSPTDSPRAHFVDIGNITLFQKHSPATAIFCANPTTTESTEEVGDEGSSLSTSSAQIKCGKLDSSNLKNLSFKQIKSATRKFHPDGLVGESTLHQVYNSQIVENKLTPTKKPGITIAIAAKKLDGLLRFGRAYKAWIRQNMLTASKPKRKIAVAVNVTRINQHGLQGHRRWLDQYLQQTFQSRLCSAINFLLILLAQAEIKYLGKLYHPNLLRLFGHCTANEQRLLVYEFMP